MGFTGKNPVHPVIQSKFLIALSKVNRLIFLMIVMDYYTA